MNFGSPQIPLLSHLVSIVPSTANPADRCQCFRCYVPGRPLLFAAKQPKWLTCNSLLQIFKVCRFLVASNWNFLLILLLLPLNLKSERLPQDQSLHPFSLSTLQNHPVCGVQSAILSWPPPLTQTHSLRMATDNSRNSLAIASGLTFIVRFIPQQHLSLDATRLEPLA